MDPTGLRQYLHDHIPLSKAMGVAVTTASRQRVTLTAPLAPNINHRETVFGGSASAVALLAAWSLLHVRLTGEDIEARVVVQRNTISYDRPMAAQFSATSEIDDEAWTRFLAILRRRGRARVAVMVILKCAGEPAGKLEGDFVAVTRNR